jgi:hypothetical protein
MRGRFGLVIAVLAASLVGASTADASSLSWSAGFAVDAHHKHLTSVSCPTASQCTAVDTYGYESSFAPSPAQPAASTFLIDTGDPDQGAQCPAGGPGQCSLDAVACPSVSTCVAVDLNSLEMTFNPAAPTAANAGEIDEGGHGSANSLNGLACVSPAQCTTVDDVGGELTFNPAHAARASGSQIDPSDSLFGLLAVACPSSSQCTAVDNTGGELTFNPRKPRFPKRVVVDPHGWLNSIACPTVTQCTAVDRHGYEVTFDPRTQHSLGRVRIDTAGLNGIACPASEECVIADRHGSVLTGSPGGHWKATHLSSTARLEAVACESRSLCVVVDSAGEAYVGR